jgi:hypothetical protein
MILLPRAPRQAIKVRGIDTKFSVPVHVITTVTEEITNMTKASIVTIESPGEIPAPLANETMRLLTIHQVNGDLDWVKDMILELEAQAKRTPTLGSTH